MFTVTHIERTESVDTKRIVCYGFDYIVPKDIKYVAVDSDGTIMGYELEPMIPADADYWLSTYTEAFDLGAVRFEGNWKESLVEV